MNAESRRDVQYNDLHDSTIFLECELYLVPLCDVLEGVSEASVSCDSLCQRLD